MKKVVKKSISKKDEIFGKYKTVTIVTGLNYYSKKESIPVIGKLPSKKQDGEHGSSAWGTFLGLRNETKKKIAKKDFDLADYSCILVQVGSGNYYERLLENSEY
jgi:hypothetical protein